MTALGEYHTINYWLVLLDLRHFLVWFSVILFGQLVGEESQQEQKERESYLRWLDLLLHAACRMPASSIPSNFVPNFLFETPNIVVSLFDARWTHTHRLKSSKSFLDLFWVLCTWYFVGYSKNYAFPMCCTLLNVDINSLKLVENSVPLYRNQRQL